MDVKTAAVLAYSSSVLWSELSKEPITPITSKISSES
jgi:hypothetical protein